MLYNFFVCMLFKHLSQSQLNMLGECQRSMGNSSLIVLSVRCINNQLKSSNHSQEKIPQKSHLLTWFLPHNRKLDCIWRQRSDDDHCPLLVWRVMTLVQNTCMFLIRWSLYSATFHRRHKKQLAVCLNHISHSTSIWCVTDL